MSMRKILDSKSMYDKIEISFIVENHRDLYLYIL